MGLQLVRRPAIAGVDFTDAESSRAWILDHVHDEIRLTGQPHPKVYLLGRDYVETLDLDLLTRTQPNADLGATFQALRRRARVLRCFLVVGAEGADPAGNRRTVALVFEERDTADGRRWWMGMLAYENDRETGLGRPLGDWQLPPDETPDPRELPDFLASLAAPPPGARAAVVHDATDLWQPDIKFKFGDLPPEAPPPADAEQMVHLTAALGVVNDLLSGAVQGTVVVRISGRAWEVWVLTGEQPAPILEMIRWIANHRLPAAEAVALAQVAIRAQDDPPVPGVQVIAEKDAAFVETWAPIAFADGPSGPKTIPEIRWWPPRPVQASHQWIGVPSKADLQEAGPMA